MREIKFRAWDEERKEMLPPWSIWKTDLFHYERTYCLRLMQFTGLRDKNGKEIYEGDILSAILHGGTNTQHIVEWSDRVMGWWARNTKATNNRDGCCQLFVYAYYSLFEVIGNIYENPEMLPSGTVTK